MSKLNGRGSTSKPAELMSLWCNLCQKCIIQLSVSWHLGWVGGEGVLTCIQTMLRTTSRFREKGVSQRGLWWNILVNGSVTQVFHNSMHKIGSGTVSAKVSCPYLEFAQTHKCIHTHKQMAMGYKEVEEIKADGRKWAFRQCNNKNNNNLMINYPASWCLLSSSRGQSLTTFMCMFVSVHVSFSTEQMQLFSPK